MAGERLSTNDTSALTTYAPPVNYMLPPTPPTSGGGYGGGGYGGGGGGGGRRSGGYSANDYEKWLRELLGRWNI